MKIALLFSTIISVLSSFSAFASDILIEDPYVRETIPGTEISSAYMTIKNQSAKDIKLTGVIASISERIELHEHIMTEEMMKMQQVDSIIIKANDSVTLQPHGYHIMIFGLKKPLTANTQVNMTLQFGDSKAIKVDVPVKGIKKSRHHH